MHHIVHKRFADIERLELYNLFTKKGAWSHNTRLSHYPFLKGMYHARKVSGPVYVLEGVDGAFIYDFSTVFMNYFCLFVCFAFY
jgi:hypothetical protein